MPSRSVGGDESGISVAPFQTRPSALGWMLIAAIGVVLYQARNDLVAVGFVIPLLLLLGTDAVLGRRAIEDRPLTIAPMRSTSSGSHGVTFRALAGPGSKPITLSVAPVERGDDVVDPVVLPAGDSSVELALGAGHPRATSYLRCCISATSLGLVWSHRWTSRKMPTFSRAPTPNAIELSLEGLIADYEQLRPYQPGDRYSRVSWSATARTGELHVRSPGPGEQELVVLFDPLWGIERGEPDPKDRSNKEPEKAWVDFIIDHLQLTADVIGAALEQGLSVRLVTRELPSAYLDRETASALANPRTGPGRIEATSAGHAFEGELLPLHTCDDLVFDQADLVRRLSLAEDGLDLQWSTGSYIRIAEGTARVVTP